MLKIAIIGVIAVLLAISLKYDQAGFGMLIILAACLLILGFSLTRLQGVLSVVETLKQCLKEDSIYIQILLKMIGVTYIAEFSGNLCKDAGYGAVAGQIEFYGKLMILAVSMPILENLITVLTGIGN